MRRNWSNSHTSLGMKCAIYAYGLKPKRGSRTLPCCVSTKQRKVEIETDFPVLNWGFPLKRCSFVLKFRKPIDPHSFVLKKINWEHATLNTFFSACCYHKWDWLTIMGSIKTVLIRFVRSIFIVINSYYTMQVYFPKRSSCFDQCAKSFR